MGSFIATVFFALVITALLWFYTHGRDELRAAREERERLKAERILKSKNRGWHYDGSIKGDFYYRIEGKTENGIAWNLVYDSDHSSSSSTPKLIFRAPSLTGGNIEWDIHDRKSYEIMQNGAVKAIVGGVVGLLSAMSAGMELKNQFYRNAKPLPAGTWAFQSRYVLSAVSAKWAALIDSDTERGILNWPDFKPSMTWKDNCFSATLEPEGLHVFLYCDGPEFEVIEHLARLGQALAENSARLKKS